MIDILDNLNRRIKFLYKHGYSVERISMTCKTKVEEIEQRLKDMGTLRGGNKIRHTQDGYTQLLINDKWVFEHRHIWEQSNGTIPDNWVVYQINGMNSDNKISNLVALPKRDKNGLLEARAKRIIELENKLGIIHPNLSEIGRSSINKKIDKYLLTKKRDSKWITPLEEGKSSRNAKEVYSVFQENPTQTIESIFKTTILMSKTDIKNGLAELIAEKVVSVSNDGYILQENEAHPKYVEGLKELKWSMFHIMKKV